MLALFPSPVFHFVLLHILTTLTKSLQAFEETGIGCLFSQGLQIKCLIFNVFSTVLIFRFS